jgi:hypothetical protein
VRYAKAAQTEAVVAQSVNLIPDHVFYAVPKILVCELDCQFGDPDRLVP